MYESYASNVSIASKPNRPSNASKSNASVSRLSIYICSCRFIQLFQVFSNIFIHHWLPAFPSQTTDGALMGAILVSQRKFGVAFFCLLTRSEGDFHIEKIK